RSQGTWNAIIAKGETKKIKGGSLVCVSKDYNLDKIESDEQVDINRKEERNTIVNISAYTLAAVIGLLLVFVVVAFIFCKIKVKKEEAVGLPSGTPVIHASTSVDAKDLDLKRTAALAIA
ncbi:hypothetical protein PFISCL1PPCAC_6639, partial [Pristionchus fissidentatus]